MPYSDIAARRAAVYQWFSALLFQELTEEQLARLDADENHAWLAALAALPGLADAVGRVEQSIGRVLQRPWRELELAADYASLLRLAPPAGVSPYAGHYPHTTAAQERQEMRRRLAEEGLAPRENEPADHIAVQLALMARMINKGEALAAQSYFLHHHLLCWAPMMAQSCLQHDEEGFYPAAVNLIVAFMREDGKALELQLTEESG